MVASRSRRHLADERGFSLIELMVVVLIIGILIGIALPVFLGARSRAEDRSTQADLRTGLAAALTYFAEAGSWTGFDSSEGASAESSLHWVDLADPTLDEISIVVHAGWNLLLVGESASGTFFCVGQVQNSPATPRGNGPSFAAVDTIAECTGGW